MIVVLTDDYNTNVIKLIAFLGNPGQKYQATRHNAGYLFFDELCSEEALQNKFHSLYVKKNGIHAIKPLTFMNLSGTAVSEAASFYHMVPEEILVIHDDLELPPGKARLQKGGGLQGHNGLRSIKERLGSGDFHRLRIGIGRPEHGDVRLYVTAPFRKDEMIIMDQLFPKLRAILDSPDKPAEVDING